MPASLTSFIDGKFDDNSTAAKIQTWMQTVVDNHHDGTKKRQIMSYLAKLIENDENIIRNAQFKVSAAKHKMKALNAALEHPTAHVDDLLTTLTLTDAQKDAAVRTLLTTDNSDSHPGALTFTSTLVVNGDNVHLTGADNGLGARTLSGGLATTTIVEGGITLQGSNIVIKGIHFDNSSSGTAVDFKCVSFTGATENVTFINCIFEGPLLTNAETAWWYGGVENSSTQYLSGNVTIKNCIIKNWFWWMLMDANTGSATPTLALKNVLFTENYIVGDTASIYPGVGSIAFRGKQSDPGALAIISKNTFDYNTTALFWNGVEVNNFQRVYVRDNDLFDRSGVTAGNLVKGFFQSWSKAGVFTFQAERNRCQGVNVCHALALGNVGAATFYGCSPESYIIVTAADLASNKANTTTGNAISLIYPFNGAGNPTQAVISGAVPTITNTSGKSVVYQTSDWVDP